MIKRVCLFFVFVFLLAPVGLSQVLSIDSIEVSVVVPDLHNSRIVEQKDTLSEDSRTELLKILQCVDSMFPVEKHFSSGRVRINLEDHYNRHARSVMYRIRTLDHLFHGTGKDTTSFNPHLIGTNWPPPREYKPFALRLKYRTPEYGDVDGYDFHRQDTTEESDRFLKDPFRADTLIDSIDQSPIKKSMERLLIEEPARTQEIWDSIPDPPSLSSDSGLFQRQSVFGSFSQLGHWDSPETDKKLLKKQVKKDPWVYGGTENIQFSQAYMDNWTKGGENNIALLSDLRLHAHYKHKNVEWESYGIHKLGVLNSGDKKARVNDDLIELNSKYGLSASEKWFYSGLFNFKTQFFNGYERSDVQKENPISGFMAPAYFTMAAGMDYKEKDFTLMLLPFSSKMTAVMDTAKVDQTRYKIDEDRKVDYMGGVSLVNNFQWEISEDFNLASNLDFFFEYMRKDNQIQGQWELILDMRISMFLSTRIGTYLRYYSNESDNLQFKENLSVSFNYRF
ncbi:MAG: DUF3078 domain-containing protein [Marinilabilia sp.]